MPTGSWGSAIDSSNGKDLRSSSEFFSTFGNRRAQIGYIRPPRKFQEPVSQQHVEFVHGRLDSDLHSQWISLKMCSVSSAFWALFSQCSIQLTTKIEIVLVYAACLCRRKFYIREEGMLESSNFFLQGIDWISADIAPDIRRECSRWYEPEMEKYLRRGNASEGLVWSRAASQPVDAWDGNYI